MSTTPSGTVVRVVQVLRALAEADAALTVAGLATQLGLPRPTIHRLLGLLRDQGMVENADGRYLIGQEYFRIGALVAARHDLVNSARPLMKRVVEECEETCLLGVYLSAERKMTFAAVEHPSNPLGYRIELNVPMSVVWGATGRAILAFLPPAEIDAVIDEQGGPSPVTGRELPSREVLEGELEEIRSQGYAYSEGQKIPDSRGLAAPIFSSSGYAVGSLCLTIPEVRYHETIRARGSASLTARAAELSRLLGYPGPGTPGA